MKSQDFETLAYTKSPKTAKRTTFQDELQAAVSARIKRADNNSYPDDFEEEEEEDEFLNELLQSRKHRSDAFKASRNRPQINDFDLSEDEEKHEKPKRVSFLKTARNKSPNPDTELLEPCDSAGLPVAGHNSLNCDFKPHSENASGDGKQIGSDRLESNSPEYRRSLKSESEVDEAAETNHEERPPTCDNEHISSEGLSLAPPRPKPRQRTLVDNQHAAEKTFDILDSQDSSRPQTSTESPDASSTVPQISSPDRITARSCSPHWTDEESASDRSTASQQMNCPRVDPDLCEEGSTLEGSKVQRNNSFEVTMNQSSGNVTFDLGKAHRSVRPQSSHKFSSVESKYLGSLKVLDLKVPQDCPPQEADSLRATIYQEWLRKKEEKSKESLELMRKERTLRQEKKKEEESKRAEATASYEAWKQKKAESLKARFREKQSLIQEEQKKLEENEKKKNSAKQMFERWKAERDNILREKHRKQKEAERKCQLKKQEEEEERMRNSKSAFSSWYEKKKHVIHQRVATERKQDRNQAEEDRYMKEERDKNAIEVYEQWLARKDLEQRRRKHERHIREILQDSPPPPWSPPNKTTSTR
ncbi:microtubule-associated protein 9 [Synchiropus picturatus]